MIKRFVGSEICYLWRFEWILGRKVDVQEEDAAFVDGTYDDIQVVSFIIKFKDFQVFFCLPGGPRIVDTHSYKLSPLGPALQFGGGSSVISASSFCIRFAEVPSAFDIFGFAFDSFVSGFGAESAELPAPLLRRPPPLEPAPLPAEVDISLFM